MTRMGAVSRLRFAAAAASSLAFGAILSVASVSGAAAEEIDVHTAHQRAQAGETALIDIRTPPEWAETGTPAGALRVTIHDARGSGGFVDRILAALGGDRHRPVALICRTANRSRVAARLLRQNGFTNVADVRGGMVGVPSEPAVGWAEAGLPIAR